MQSLRSSLISDQNFIYCTLISLRAGAGGNSATLSCKANSHELRCIVGRKYPQSQAGSPSFPNKSSPSPGECISASASDSWIIVHLLTCAVGVYIHHDTQLVRYICTYIQTDVCPSYVSVLMYVCIYVSMYVVMYACMLTHMHVCTYECMHRCNGNIIYAHACEGTKYKQASNRCPNH